MTVLETLTPQIDDSAAIKMSELLVQKTKNLLEEIEFNYR